MKPTQPQTIRDIALAEWRKQPDQYGCAREDPTASSLNWLLVFPALLVAGIVALWMFGSAGTDLSPAKPRQLDGYEAFQATEISREGQLEWQDTQTRIYEESKARSGVDPAVIDCPSFSTQREAQIFFLANDPNSDPYVLDWDHDGIACETLP